jgi:hypothetical protein
MASDSLRTLRRAKRYYAVRLFGHPNVVGVGIGQKLTDGEATGDLAIRVYVTRKVSLAELADDDRLPVRLDVPESRRRPGAFEVPVDVIEVGDVKPVGMGRTRPLRMGFDISRSLPSLYDRGTMGAVVADQLGRRYLLSCNHVLADVNNGATGDAIKQPSNGGTQNVIGDLARYVPIRTVGLNRIDAALAALVTGVDQGTFIDGIGPITQLADPVPARGTAVQLTGSNAAEPRFGVIDDRDAEWIVNYGGVQAGFQDQVLITTPTTQGDSGSLVVTLTGRAVAIVIAGGPGSPTVCSPLKDVLRELGSGYLTGTGEDLRLQLV